MKVIIEKKVISAPIRWAGSKKKLLNELFQVFDSKKNVYVEPFLGSGVVLLNALENKMYGKYYVNDVNRNVILFYKTLRDDTEKILVEIAALCTEYNSLQDIESKSQYYYEKRKSFNCDSICDLTRASIFWFLMKSGYNGVYRVNAKGYFNVPCGKRKKIIYDEKKLQKIAGLLKNVKFYCLDYKNFIDLVYEEEKSEEIFMYCDPPYIPETKASETHVLYTKQEFMHKEFVEKMKSISGLNNTSIMISMSESEKVSEIYTTDFLRKYDINEILRAVNPAKKIKSKEVAFLNYKIN